MHQVSPPDLGEQIRYINSKRTLYLIPGIISSLLLISGGIFFSISRAPLLPFLIFILVICIYLGISYLIVALGKDFDSKKYMELREKYEDSEPSVDVYLPICGEDSEVILNVWNHVSLLDYRNFKVYVLDDSKTEVMKEEAVKRGFFYLRREGRSFKKAGNLLNAFTKTDGEFILILDADFVPCRDFLKSVVPYMLEDSKVAIVQTPQYFEVAEWMGWLEKAAGYVQELFYRLVQQSRDRFGGTICVGSCALYRRRALESIGGPRQIEHSEDVWTGFTCVSKGWKVKYLPLNLSKGRCPDELRAFFQQQYRWCSGSMSLCFSTEFWKSPLTMMQKICYFSGMLYYIASALGVYFVQIPSAVMVNFFPDKVHWFNIIYYGPSFLFSVVMVYLWSSYDGYNLNFMRLRHASYYAHWYALRDRLLNSTVGWIATGAKTKQKSRFDNYRIFCFWMTTAFYSMILFGVSRNAGVYGWWNFVPPAFFATFNYWLAMSCLRDQS